MGKEFEHYSFELTNREKCIFRNNSLVFLRPFAALTRTPERLLDAEYRVRFNADGEAPSFNAGDKEQSLILVTKSKV